jgi:hypothetical protein
MGVGEEGSMLKGRDLIYKILKINLIFPTSPVIL